MCLINIPPQVHSLPERVGSKFWKRQIETSGHGSLVNCPQRLSSPPFHLATTFGLSVASNVSPPLFCLSKALMEDGGQLSSANNCLSEQWRRGHGGHGDYSHWSPSGATMLAIHSNEGLLLSYIYHAHAISVFFFFALFLCILINLNSQDSVWKFIIKMLGCCTFLYHYSPETFLWGFCRSMRTKLLLRIC